jgi:hypothetical protein
MIAFVVPIPLTGTKFAAFWISVEEQNRMPFFSKIHHRMWCTLTLLLASNPLAADDWGSNLRWSFDATSRSQYITSGQDRLGFQTTIGLDTQQVITGLDHNIATVTLQLYTTRANDLRRAPPYIAEDGEWKFLPKVNTINFHLNRNGRFNFLIGHPELPYGLEVPISTNGTLRQLLTGKNLGLKVDWGVGINGILPNMSYAMTLTRGSGVDYHRNGEPWALTGRVGSKLNSQDYVGEPGFGLSWFAGKVRTPKNTMVDRRRIGLDGQWYQGPFGLMAEVSVGDDDGEDVINSFLEVNRINRNARFTGYAQGRWLRRRLDGTWQDASSWTAGFRFTPSERWAFSLQFEHEAKVPADRPTDNIINFQFRFRS